MAQAFKTKELILTRQVVTATGNNIYINGLLAGSGIYTPTLALEATGVVIYGIRGELENLKLGTPSQFWQLYTGFSGVKLKNTESGLHLRNFNDSESADLRVRNLYVEGTETINNTDNLFIANQYIYLNQSGVPQDGGVIILRSGQTAAVIDWNESTQFWQAGLSGLESRIILATDTGQFASANALINSGIALIARDNSISGVLALSIFNTGAEAITHCNAISSIISGNLLQSGNILNNIIIATGNSSVAHTNSIGLTISGNLTQSGITLFDRDAQISGGLEVRISASGNSAVNHSNSIGQTISGNLTSTGIQLGNRITTVESNLTQTGVNLIARDLSISGGIEVRITASGGSAILHSNSIGQTISGNLTQTGITLFARDASISGDLEARITASGSSVISHSNNIGQTISGNLTNTGIALISRDNSISGVLQGYINSTSSSLANVVYTTGNQDIASVKRFNSGLFTGTVGIATTNPKQPLSVKGIISSDETEGNGYYGAWMLGKTTAGTESYLGLGPWYSQAGYIKWIDNDRLSIFTYSNSKNLTLQESGGNVGIGVTTPTHKLTVSGSALFQGNGSHNLIVKGAHATPPNLAYLANDAFTKIYTRQDSIYGIGIFDQSTATAIQSADISGGAAAKGLLLNPFGGNVGINNNNPQFNLEVSGSFAATTKSFIITHPTKVGKRLAHGALEGPEYGIYVRGHIGGSGIIQLPDYWKYLARRETITVQLTASGKYQKLYIKNIEDGQIQIANHWFWRFDKSDKSINAHYVVNAERADVQKLNTEV